MPPYKFIRDTRNQIEESFKLVFETTAVKTQITPVHFIGPSRFEKTGLTINKSPNKPPDLVFLCGFFEGDNQIRLIRRDGSVVAKWPLKFDEIFDSKTVGNWEIDTHGALALPDGSVLFNFEYRGLAKLDRHGKVLWTLNRRTHHSIEPAEKGGFWVCGRRRYAGDIAHPFPNYKKGIWEDTIIRLSDDGKILTEVSVPKILHENGFTDILWANRHPIYGNNEIVHINSITELPSKLAKHFPQFEPGDLAVSMRFTNFVFVVDPDNWKIKWHSIGPWAAQHDPEFIPNGMIYIFNNNVDPNVKEAKPSNIIAIDPATNKYEIIYGNKEGQELISMIRSKLDYTHSGNLLINEFQFGRVFEIDPDGNIVWEFINPYEEDQIAEITEARVYPASYFKVPEWNLN